MSENKSGAEGEGKPAAAHASKAPRPVSPDRKTAFKKSHPAPGTLDKTYYHTYLGLDKLLGAQAPRSAMTGQEARHDEMLFIIVHQVFELWFKQIMHELNSVTSIMGGDHLPDDSMMTCVHRLNRVVEVLRLMVGQFRVLETMTPLDFLEFRSFLFPASGFQSVQFRLYENKLGMKSEWRLQYQQQVYYRHFTKEHGDILAQSELEHDSSLLKVVERWLERTPFVEFDDFDFWQHYRSAVDLMLQQERESINESFSEPEERSKALQSLESTEKAFATVFDEDKHNELMEQGHRRLSYKATQAALLVFLYRDMPIMQLPYQLLSLLVDIDELTTQWRHGHTTMVHRMIGTKVGTGGSSGYHYLKMTLSERYKVFMDFFNLSTYLVPRSALPKLPPKVQRSLGFYHHSTRTPLPDDSPGSVAGQHKSASASASQ